MADLYNRVHLASSAYNPDDEHFHPTVVTWEQSENIDVTSNERPCRIVRLDDKFKVDTQDTILIPSLMDGHIHFTSWVQWQAYRDLGACDTVDKVCVAMREEHEAIERRQREFGLAERVEGEHGKHIPIIVGKMWVPSFPLHGDEVYRTRLDNEVTDQVPVMVFGKDLHSVWMNTRAMKLLGYSVDKPDDTPSDDPTLNDSDVVRAPNGVATGVIQDTGVFHAIEYLDLFPRLTEDTLRFAEDYCFAHGITHIISFEDRAGLNALGELADKLRMHVSFYVHELLLPALEQGTLELPTSPNDNLHFRGVKLFMDGSMGSDTAWMSEPYTHNSEELGRPIKTEEELTSLITRIYKINTSVAIHAIGDRAVQVVADKMLELEPLRQPSTYPPQIEHFQCADPAVIKRIAGGPITASMQPCHMIFDDETVRVKWGEKRMQWAFPVNQLLEHNCRVVFGSDAPVEPVLPLRNIQACEMLWCLDARPSRELALTCSTYNGRLTLSEGDDATFTVWPRELLTADKDAVLALRPMMTVLDGVTVFCREAYRWWDPEFAPQFSPGQRLAEEAAIAPLSPTMHSVTSEDYELTLDYDDYDDFSPSAKGQGGGKGGRGGGDRGSTGKYSAKHIRMMEARK